MRLHHEHLQAHEVMVVADALDMHLLPKVGAAWMRHGTQDASMTPGTTEKPYLAGALHRATGKVRHGLGPRKTHGVFRALLTLLDTPYSAPGVTRISGVVDNYRIHQAKAVPPWLTNHPRFVGLWFPTSCPRANPIARVVGDVHDKCTRNHKRKRLRDRIQDVERHRKANGPWQSRLSPLYAAPEVTAAVEYIAAEPQGEIAA
jgi:hypothetical protein